MSMRLPAGYTGSRSPPRNDPGARTADGRRSRPAIPIQVITSLRASHIFEPIGQIFVRNDEQLAGGLPNEDAQSFVFDSQYPVRTGQVLRLRPHGRRHARQSRRSLYRHFPQRRIAFVVCSVSLTRLPVSTPLRRNRISTNVGAESRDLKRIAVRRMSVVLVSTCQTALSLTAEGRFDRGDLCNLERSDVGVTYTGKIGSALLLLTRLCSLSRDMDLPISRNEFKGGATRFASRNTGGRLVPSAMTSRTGSSPTTPIGFGYADECFAIIRSGLHARA